MKGAGPRTVDGPLTPLEIASGTPLQPLGSRDPSEVPDPRESPIAALEAVAAEILQRGTTTVSFSGGRDSSLILALFDRVARREGLERPVPVTMRHPSPSSQESEWQELVVRHLDCPDWVHYQVGDTLDLLGDIGREFLEHAGVVAPPNAYLHVGIARAHPSATLVTGAGGDEALVRAERRVTRVRYGRAPRRRGDALRIALASAPRPVRRAVHQRNHDPLPPRYGDWLRPDVLASLRRHLADSAVAEIRWDRSMAAWPRSRYVVLLQQALAQVTRLTGTRIESPLMSPRFTAAWAVACGPGGPVNRDHSMQTLAHDLLPPELITRRTKAGFAGLLQGEGFYAFANAWDPATLAPSLRELIDAEAVRNWWLTTDLVYPTLMIMQQAYLDQRRAGWTG